MLHLTRRESIATMLAFGASMTFGVSAAQAGPQYLDKTGYAVSGYDVVAYRSLRQSKLGAQQPKAVPGRKEFTTEWNGAKWAFSSAENRDAFIKNPAAYAPLYDGHCAYGVAVGGKVPGNPHLWRIVDGKLYLNITPEVVEIWEKDIPGYIAKAEKLWRGLEAKAASRAQVPYFDTRKAPV